MHENPPSIDASDATPTALREVAERLFAQNGIANMSPRLVVHASV